MQVAPPSSYRHQVRRRSPASQPLAEPAMVLVVLLLSVPLPAHAYIDPGAGPLLWQMLVAGFAGALYQLTRWLRRGKSRKKNDETGNE